MKGGSLFDSMKLGNFHAASYIDTKNDRGVRCAPRCMRDHVNSEGGGRRVGDYLEG